ncbi:DUF6197 family protein [Streptomyces antimycoticus]
MSHPVIPERLVEETGRLAAQMRIETTRGAIRVLEAAAKVIDANGYFNSYLWNTKQAEAGTPLKYCRVDLIGAIAIALHDDPRCAAYSDVRHIERLLDERVDAPTLAAWCSYPGNGKHAALKLLRTTVDEFLAIADVAA